MANCNVKLHSRLREMAFCLEERLVAAESSASTTPVRRSNFNYFIERLKLAIERKTRYKWIVQSSIWPAVGKLVRDIICVRHSITVVWELLGWMNVR